MCREGRSEEKFTMVVGASENVQVVVRVRPLTGKERDRGEDELVACVGDRTLQVLDPEQQRGRSQTATAYQFNRAFGTECTQDALFKSCGVVNLLDHVLDGYSATVFAYGPTGSGKTYTITGRPESIVKHGSGDVSDGLVIRSVETLFNKVRSLQRDGLQFKVRASCVEIYNESVLDLLKSGRGSSNAENLAVRFDTSKASFFVSGLSYGKCPSEEELLKLYMKALRNRSVAAHDLNRDSSRSHAILTVYVDSMVQEEGGQISTRHGKISFVDLAGSERLKASHSEGLTRRETGAINKSVFTLGKVISSLCDRKRTTKVPFRDSKLTQLLMDSIGGSSLTIMLACVAPCGTHLSETLRTLDYASRAKHIKNRPVVLLDPQQEMLQELKKEIEALRAENAALRDALVNTTSLSLSASLNPSAGSLSASLAQRQSVGTAKSAPEARDRASPAPHAAHHQGPSNSLRSSPAPTASNGRASLSALNRSSDSVLSFESPREQYQSQQASVLRSSSPAIGGILRDEPDRKSVV